MLVTRDAQSFVWENYGLKLHIPKGCLPAGVDLCKIRIQASIAGQYEFPENSHLVSAVFWFKCEHSCVFTRPITLEMHHCAKSKSASRLRFVKASCRQDQLPYTFEEISVGGKFNRHSSYGVLDLKTFSGIATVQSGSEEREYCAMLFYTCVEYQIIIKHLNVSEDHSHIYYPHLYVCKVIIIIIIILCYTRTPISCQLLCLFVGCEERLPEYQSSRRS